ncbi:MAG: S-layer homology domain-containing protein, partial [Clostridia bacterium]|nr:S-layer homology domain-containing protein [Clostridia bacterium]
MKRLLCFILATVMVVGIVPAVSAAYIDVNASDSYYNSALRLQDLGIISGYSDGTFGATNNISRAEFTKVVVCMMDKEREAKSLSSLPAFSDIERGYWASAYISYATRQDILSGYADGTFGPNKNISFAEALTILLRTIGYKEADVGYFWPNNYIDAAASMGISAGLNYAPGDAITRGDAAILTDRTLFAKPSNSLEGASGKETYLETIGYTVLEDALILDNDTSNNNISVLSGNLKLGSAATYVGRTQIKVSAGEVYNHVVIDKDGYLAAVNGYAETSDETKSEIGTVTRLTGNTIEYTGSNGQKGTYKANDDFTVYYNSNKMTFANAKNYITGGTEITFFGKDYGLWNVAVLGGADDIDPVLASRSYTDDDVALEGMTINKENLIVYRDGGRATLGDIEMYDAVYYNQKTNTMEVYSKKVTGVYYDAKPSKAYVESVTVGGKDYEIGYAGATSRLDASLGAFEIGDKITLILGKNDEIVFVTDSAGGVDYFSY